MKKESKILICIQIKVLIITLFSGLLFSTAYSQQEDYQQSEIISYDFYTRQQWDTLIRFNEKLFNRGVDYFYLRTRSGIAFFNKGNFDNAIFHLEKAYQFNSEDHNNISYLFLAYINTGRLAEAWKLEKKHPSKLKALSDETKPGYYSVYAGGGYIASNNFKANSKKTQTHKDSIYAEKDLYGNMPFTEVLFSRPLTKAIYLTAGASYLHVSKRKTALYNSIEKTGYDTIFTTLGYYIDTVYSKRLYNINEDYPLKQFQFYVSPHLLLQNGLKLKGGLSVLKTSYRVFSSRYSLEEYFAQSYDTIPSVRTVYTFPEQDTNFFSVSTSIGIQKNYKRFFAGLSLGYSNINNKSQYFSSLMVAYYPKGNRDLIFTGELTVINEHKETNPVFKLAAASKIFSKSWMDFNISAGKMKNYSSENSYLINNSGDENYFRAGIGLLYQFSKRMSFYINTVASMNRGSYFSVLSDNTLQYYEYKYQNLNLTGGILWKL